MSCIHRTVKNAYEIRFSFERRRNSSFRFPTDAREMAKYGQKYLSKPKKKESKVKWRYFECIDNGSANFLRNDTQFTYFKDNRVVEKMAGINDQHRFRFEANIIRAYRTFTMHDKPFTY